MSVDYFGIKSAPYLQRIEFAICFKKKENGSNFDEMMVRLILLV